MINPFKQSRRDEQADAAGEGWCATLPAGRFGFGLPDLLKRRGAPDDNAPEPDVPPTDLRSAAEERRR